MSVYLNENNNIKNEINEFKLDKEYQILSKNSCLFLNAENENIINNAKIESYSHSRKNNKNSNYGVDEGNMFSMIMIFLVEVVIKMKIMIKMKIKIVLLEKLVININFYKNIY